MAGYADYRRLLMQGYTPEEIAVILGKPGGTTKVNEGNRRVPGAVYQQNQPTTPTRDELQARKPKKKQIYERLPGMEPDPNRNFDPGIAELQASPYSTPYNPGEFVGSMPDPGEQALRQGQALVAQATGSLPQPLPEQAARAQAAVQAVQAPSGPKVNWQNPPSMDFYEQSAGWNMRDNGAPLRPGMGRMPATAQGLPNVSKAILEQGPQQQVDQQRQMMETAFANSEGEAAQNVLQANRSMLDMFGKGGGNPLLGGSFLGKLFGGLF